MSRWSVTAARPVPTADTCLVFVDGNGTVYAPDQPITLGQAVWGSLRRLYEVDMAEHRAELQLRLPCREKGFFFDVALRLHWRVHRPDQIVRDRRADVVPLYADCLAGFLAEHGEQFGLEERTAAQGVLQQKLGSPISLPEGITIVRCGIELNLGDEADTYLKERTRHLFTAQTDGLASRRRIDELERMLEEQEQDHKLQALKGQQRGEHQVRQADQQAILEERRRAEELREEQHTRERERREDEHTRELQQLELKAKFERMAMYEEALKRGHAAYLVLFLEQNPGDVNQVVNLILAERRNNFEHSQKLMITLLEAGLIDGADMDPARKRALQNLFEGLDPGALDGILGGAPRALDQADDDGEGDGDPASDGDTGDDHVTEARLVGDSDDDDDDDDED